MKNNKAVIIGMVALFVTLVCVLGVMLGNNLKVSASSDSKTYTSDYNIGTAMYMYKDSITGNYVIYENGINVTDKYIRR